MPGSALSKTAFTPTTSYTEGTSKEKVGTQEFAQAVVARLGQKPEKLKAVTYKSAPKKQEAAADQSAARPRAQKQLVGVDVFVDWTDGSANDLGAKMEQLAGSAVKLVMIDSRGTKVYPGGFPETITGDLWRCRFEPTGGSGMQHSQIIDLLGRIQAGWRRLRQDREPVHLRRAARILARSRAVDEYTAGCCHYGQQIRLGNHAARRRDAHSLSACRMNVASSPPIALRNIWPISPHRRSRAESK